MLLTILCTRLLLVQYYAKQLFNNEGEWIETKQRRITLPLTLIWGGFLLQRYGLDFDFQFLDESHFLFTFFVYKV